MISIILLVGGLGLCLFHSLTSAVVRADIIKTYREKIDSTPFKESYTRAEVAEAAWQVWTNRMRLPAQDSFKVSELQEGIFGLRSNQLSFDRGTFEAVVAKASGYKQQNDSGLTWFGVTAMLAGAFMLGGVMFPAKDKKSP